jgi:hypothetical protein
MMRQTHAVVVFVLVVGCTVSSAQQNAFVDALRASRYELSVVDGRLSGPGGAVIRSAIEPAQFVLIGEDHGIAQIPDFVGAVCEALAPRGFHTMALEAGPLATAELQGWLAAPSTAQMRLVEFATRFPGSIAFYDMREENDSLLRCAREAGTRTLDLWGIDQEFLGSSKMILTRILETHPGPNAMAAVERLLQENARADAEAAAPASSGGRIFTTAVPDEDLANLRRLLQTEGNQAAQSLIEALIRTHEIYALNGKGRGYESNRQRALLMKTLFERRYQAAVKAGSDTPKVLFKFGLYHMYRGFNPLNSLEIGNHVAELAEGHGTTSVHIMIVAVKGSQLAFAGFQRPFAPRTFNQIEGEDASLAYLKPMADNLVDSGWTLFDLRELRKRMRLIDSAELRRVVTGFDLLVVIPEARPSTQLR